MTQTYYTFVRIQRTVTIILLHPNLQSRTRSVLKQGTTCPTIHKTNICWCSSYRFLHCV